MNLGSPSKFVNFLYISATIALGFALLGCSAADKVRASGEIAKLEIEKARERGAQYCMGKELAYAETHYDFAMAALDEGKWYVAERMMEVSRKNSKPAMEGSDPEKCLPKEEPPPEPVREPPPPPPKDPCLEPDPDNPPPDTDGDGLDDCIDKCPYDPGPIENNGCPWGDRDGDGILDNIDKCPDTPGIPEFDGCPDTDGDGIPDHLDKCPDVPGIPEEDGCPPKKVYKKIVVKLEEGEIEIKEQVLFQTGKSTILPGSFQLLSEIAEAIKDIPPKYRVSVEGHTDNVGGYKYNKKLSDARAKSVLEHLVNKEGIQRERLQAIGWGYDKPIADNRTKRGREQNRRVEFLIIDETGQRLQRKKTTKEIEIETEQ